MLSLNSVDSLFTSRSFCAAPSTIAETIRRETLSSKKIAGTCQLMTKVGQQWPFYSYRLNTLTQYSQELDRTVRAELLSLVTDLEGSSEVGGLFLHPNNRAGGLGLLLARSRYLLIAPDIERFGTQFSCSRAYLSLGLYEELESLLVKT